MTKNELAYILEKRRWPWSWQRAIGHIMFMIFPFSLLLISGSMWYGGIKYGHIYEDHFMNGFFATALIGALLGLFLFIYFIIRIKSQRAFRTVAMSKKYDGKDILKIVRDLGWKGTFDKKKNVIHATTRISAFSWGEKITIIILDNDFLLYNSRPSHQPITIGKDYHNFKKFLEQIHLLKNIA